MTKWMIFLPCKLLQHYHLLKSLASQNRDCVSYFDGARPSWVVALNWAVIPRQPGDRSSAARCVQPEALVIQ